MTAVDEARSYLNSRLSARLTDDRLIQGTFMCLDRQGNVLLRDAVEVGRDSASHERHLGIVLVPLRYIRSCRVPKPPAAA